MLDMLVFDMLAMLPLPPTHTMESVRLRLKLMLTPLARLLLDFPLPTMLELLLEPPTLLLHILGTDHTLPPSILDTVPMPLLPMLDTLVLDMLDMLPLPPHTMASVRLRLMLMLTPLARLLLDFLLPT